MRILNRWIIAIPIIFFPLTSGAAMDWWKGVTVKSVGYYPYGGNWILQVKIESIPSDKIFTCTKTSSDHILSSWESSPNATVTPIRHSTLLAALATERTVNLYVDNAICSPDVGLLIQGVIIN